YEGRLIWTVEVALFLPADSATNIATGALPPPYRDFFMDRIRLVGGNELRGEIPISGAKNAALPLMIASLLTDEPLVLTNVPRLADVKQLERILENHGVDIAVHGRRRGEEGAGQRMTFHAADIVDTTAPYELVSKM